MYAQRRPWEPPRLYSWSIVGGAGVGACGVTDDYEVALNEVVDALARIPAGPRGLVHRVALSFIRTAYVYERLIARCRIDPVGDLAWDDLPAPSAWTRLRPMFTDPGQVLGDAIPPEAITTGLLDIQAHKERLERSIASSTRDRR
ncbi:hypothetical protein [Actinomadura alba]|uniref:Uncharacterized protein n=1 Tax=Actinomadura alba TaxID=406431 RepID=A0ABR7LS41_9ACTN|nr:hypothetical protein [Actinomadura alba]MBC6467657.1 hypothetical protein [Actinomadura alba]